MISELNSPIPNIELKIIEPQQDGYPTPPILNKVDDLKYSLTMAPNYGMKVDTVDFNEKGFDSSQSLKEEERNLNISIDTRIDNGKYIDYKDTLYLDFNLQGLGTAMSDIWDIVYGKDRKQNIS